MLRIGGLDIKSTVILGSLKKYSLENHMNKTLTAIGLDEDFSQARAVFIKPNLTYPRYKQGVTTRVEFVAALVAALRKINSTTKIYIGEGEGGYNSFSMTEAMKSMGYFDLAAKYPNVEIINLSGMPIRKVELEAFGRPYALDLPAIFFDEIDFSISCPVPKVHCMTRITLSMKNQWGCVPDIMRLKNHYAFDHIISQICDKLKFRYAFLDGLWGLDDNGPMQGTPTQVNWFVASNSLGAHDLVVSQMMGFEWDQVGHLREAKKRGFLPTEEEIEVDGDIQSLRQRFFLRRTFWNYPALIAFYSLRMTQLVYLSKFSKLIHDVMYFFRKRPID